VKKGETILKLKVESSFTHDPKATYRIIRTEDGLFFGQYIKKPAFYDEDSKTIKAENELAEQSVSALLREIENTLVPVYSEPGPVIDGTYYELGIGDDSGRSLFRWCSRQLPSAPWLPLDQITQRIIATVPDTPLPLPLFVAAAERNSKHDKPTPAKVILDKVVAFLQGMEATLSGDDTPLATVWDEIKEQVQNEKSYCWDAYEQTMRSLIDGYIEEAHKSCGVELPPHFDEDEDDLNEEYYWMLIARAGEETIEYEPFDFEYYCKPVQDFTVYGKVLKRTGMDTFEANAFSIAAPNGEFGQVYASEAECTLSKEEFEFARQHGWPVEWEDPTGEILPPEANSEDTAALRPKCEPRNDAEIKLMRFENLAVGLQHDDIYFNAPEVCDICKKPLADKRFMIDGNFKPGGCLWGCMCARCFLEVGEGIGWGRGQLYTHLENGEWLMTAGFCPED